eukprot:scaffold2267_cov187-Ochromonas_danica.AAC.3
MESTTSFGEEWTKLDIIETSPSSLSSGDEVLKKEHDEGTATSHLAEEDMLLLRKRMEEEQHIISYHTTILYSISYRMMILLS